MRFSIRWMLAAVAYFAVVCTSVVYAATLWTDAFVILGMLALGGAVVGVVVGKGSGRAFWVGFLAFAVLMRVTMFGGFSFTSDWKTTIERGIEATVAWLPHPKTTVDLLMKYVAQETENNPNFRAQLLEMQQRAIFLQRANSRGGPAPPAPAPTLIKDALAMSLGDSAADALKGADGDSDANDVANQLAPDDQRRLRSRIRNYERINQAPAASVLRQHVVLFSALLGGLIGSYVSMRQANNRRPEPAAQANQT